MITKFLSKNFIQHVLIFFLFVINESFSREIFSSKNLDSNKTISVDGFINFYNSHSSQDKNFEKKQLPNLSTKNYNNTSNNFGNDAQFFVKTINESNDEKYGMISKFEYNINSQNRNQNFNLDQIFLFDESDFGKIEIGNNQAVNQKMKFAPSRFARGAGGINGKYLEHVNLPMLNSRFDSNQSICNPNNPSSCSSIKLPSFILLAHSPIGHGGYAKSFYPNKAENLSANSSSYSTFNRRNFRSIKDDSFDGMEDATKINYYSKRINGFQVGASYTPDSTNNGFTSNNINDIDHIKITNILSFGINYLEDFDNLEVALFASAEKGNVKNSRSLNQVKRDDLFAYDTGFILSYFGFKLGASYGVWKSYLQPKNGIYSCDYNSNQIFSNQNCESNIEKFSDPNYYTGGIAYQFGPIATSITTIRSVFQKNLYRATSFGLDYKLNKSLMPYFEFTKFSFSSNQPRAADIVNQNTIFNTQRQVQNNNGNVFLIGILFSF